MNVSFIRNIIEAYCYDRLGYEICSFNEKSRLTNKQKQFMVVTKFHTSDICGEGAKNRYFISEWEKTKAQAYESLYYKVLERSSGINYIDSTLYSGVRVVDSKGRVICPVSEDY